MKRNYKIYKNEGKLAKIRTMKLNGMFTVEMAYIAPFILMIFFLSIMGIFYYHDKALTAAAAHETAAIAGTKVREKDAACVGAEEVLYMATTGGAAAMGLNECDSLAEGKKADLIMLDLKQPNMQPENNLVRNIVYSGSKQNVKLTMVNGQILYEDNTFQIGFEPEEIYRKANEIIGRMK